ncbi:MAG: DUF1002 domain-containing protein [Bacillota bacterium]|nr:DUF1002 domain-containing protein [Bacillota bacterium]
MKKWMMSLLVSLTLVLLLPISSAAAGKTAETQDASDLIGQIKQQLEAAFEHVDEETIGEVISFVKEKVQEGKLDSPEEIQSAIEEGEEKFQVEINEEAAQKLVQTMEKLEQMGFSAEYIIEKAEGLYKEYGADFVDHVDEVVTGAVKNAAENVINNFFEGFKNSIKSFFQNLFH